MRNVAPYPAEAEWITLAQARFFSNIEIFDRAMDHPVGVLSNGKLLTTGQAYSVWGYTSTVNDPQAVPKVIGTGAAARITTDYAANTVLGSFISRATENPVMYMRARWSINPNTYNGSATAGTANTGTVGIIGAQPNFGTDPNNAPNALCHLSISPTDWTYAVILNKSVINLITGTFATPLAQDGTTIHTCEVVIDRYADAAYLYLPDNTIRRVTPISNGFLNFDTDLATANFELYKFDGSRKMPEIVDFAADSRRGDWLLKARRDYAMSADPEQGVQVVTGSLNAVPKVWYRWSGAAGTITLPTAPADGSEVTIENTNAAGAADLTVSRGGSTDTIESATTITVTTTVRVDFEYKLATNTWYMKRDTWVATPGTGLRRDSNGRAQVAAPSVAADIANKGYVDTAYKAYTAPTGQLNVPTFVTAAAAQTSNTSGVVTLFPWDVGPGSLTVKALACNVSTAQAAGTGTLVKGVIYADNGTGGAPLLTSAGKLAEVTFTATATGIKIQALSSNVTLPQGRYWIGGFYYQGSVAPTTVPLLTAASGGAGVWTTTTSFSPNRYLRVTGLTDLPVASQAPTPGIDAQGILVFAQSV